MNGNVLFVLYFPLRDTYIHGWWRGGGWGERMGEEWHIMLKFAGHAKKDERIDGGQMRMCYGPFVLPCWQQSTGIVISSFPSLSLPSKVAISVPKTLCLTCLCHQSDMTNRQVATNSIVGSTHTQHILFIKY